MITRTELRRIPRLHRQIVKDKEQLSYLKEKATAISSALGIDSEKVQKTPSNIAGKYIEATVDLNKEIAAKELELLTLQDKAEKFIKLIPDGLTHRIFKLRYLKCCSWKEVADITGYDIRHTQRLEKFYINQLDI